MTGTLDSALIARLRDVVAGGGVTETELRELIARADGRARALGGRVVAGERRLRALNADANSSIRKIADELRRVETARRELAEVRELLAGLEALARQIRTQWLRRQAGLPA